MYRFAIALTLGLLLTPDLARAQYPTSRPVRIIMPYAVGGTGDLLIRGLAQRMSQDTGHAFIVENKPGAIGKIGYQMVASAAPDGYTLVAADGGYAMLPALSKTLSWNFDTDLVPVTIYAQTPYVIVVPASSRIKSFRELLAEAKANPGKFNYGSSGTGGATHIAMELLQQKAGVSMTHVPFKGNGDAIISLIGAQIDLVLTSVPTAMSQIKSGKLRALAVTSQKRVSALTDVPTAAEAGLNFDLANWYGIMAPNGTPTTAIDYVVQKIGAALQSTQVKESFELQGADPVIMSPTEFKRVLQSDVKLWSSTIPAAGIKPE